MEQRLTSGRILRFASVALTAPAAGADPHFALSPVTPWGTPTTGVLFGLKSPTAPTGVVAAAPPASEAFSMTLWVQNPIDGSWLAFSSVSVAQDAAYVNFDVGPSRLWIQLGNVGTAGLVDLHVMEQ